ncbi:MAG TPA: hypothetical protein HA326_02285, partial [Thermoplasmata archaeon]|nr:hypothetical protein [Thermoplasmata archaeon]
AYEPVWAIGTGVVASVEEVAEAHQWLEEELAAVLDDDFNTPDAVYRLQQMTEALKDLPDLSAEEGRRVVALYAELGGILGLFSDVGAPRSGPA